MVLYHGSNKVIKNPIYHGGKQYNDYGYGFYCTESIDLAKEWASPNEFTTGYVNKYEIDISTLKVLDLRNKEYSILNWIAILLNNRMFDLSNAMRKKSRDYFIKNFYINVEDYDVVIGYRADDSYF